MHEWPLLVFTLSMQLAWGAFCFANWPFRQHEKLSTRSMGFFNLRLILLAGLGLAASFAHLGMPLHAYFALNNLKSSWMSREILLASLFMAGLAVVTLMQLGWLPLKRFIRIKVWATVLVGLALMLTMARLYMLSTVPAWNHWHTPVSFLSTAVLLGAILVWHQTEGRHLPGTALAGLLVSLAALLIWMLSLKTGEAAHTRSLSMMLNDYRWLTAGAVILKLTAIVWSIGLLQKNVSGITYNKYWGFTALVLAAEVAHRLCFYVAYDRFGM